MVCILKVGSGLWLPDCKLLVLQEYFYALKWDIRCLKLLECIHIAQPNRVSPIIIQYVWELVQKSLGLHTKCYWNPSKVSEQQTNRPCHPWSQTILGTSWDESLFSDHCLFFCCREWYLCRIVIHSFNPPLLVRSKLIPLLLCCGRAGGLRMGVMPLMLWYYRKIDHTHSENTICLAWCFWRGLT